MPTNHLQGPPGVKQTNFTLGLEKQKTTDELFARSLAMPIRGSTRS